MTTSASYFRGNDNFMKILEISPTSVFVFRGNDNLAIRNYEDFCKSQIFRGNAYCSLYQYMMGWWL